MSVNAAEAYLQNLEQCFAQNQAEQVIYPNMSTSYFST